MSDSSIIGTVRLQEAAVHENVLEMHIWTEENAAHYLLADALKDYVEELCGLENDSLPIMARQVIGAGLCDVDWDEIANHYLSEI